MNPTCGSVRADQQSPGAAGAGQIACLTQGLQIANYNSIRI